MQDGLENAREIEQLPHATKATADPSEGFHVTSIGWNVSSLQTNIQRQGDKIVTSSEDTYARIWNEQGQLMKVMKDHKDCVNVAKWNKECTVIATAGFDKKVIVSSNEY